MPLITLRTGCVAPTTAIPQDLWRIDRLDEVNDDR
jgi:hypothetical protein